MRFTKMHGNGNDYIYIDCFTERVDETEAPVLARRLSDRHRGVGSDGLVLIRPSGKADCRMDMYNADGSRARMCGNAIRCVGRLVLDRGIVARRDMTVETLAGIKSLVVGDDSVTVNMGRPDWRPSSIPMDADGDDFIDRPVSIGGGEFRVTCVNTGSSHAVVFVDDTETFDVPYYGGLIENHTLFPDRVNVNFARIDDGCIVSRTWERGSGETMACGSGASACMAVCAALGMTGRDTVVRQRGGSLRISQAASGDIFMNGPAEYVFQGKIYP